MKRMFFLFCLIQQFLYAASGDRIGTITALEGLVKAIGVEGVERALRKGAAIFQSEVIQVAEDGKAQIQFTDGGIMNLISGSEFRVDSYRYRQVAQKDQFLASLLKGGFRSLSGSIAKKNAREYEIRTPTATIGVRGTIIEVSIVGTEVFFGVSEGRAIISNGGGSQQIGVGEEGQFVLVRSADAPPQLISTRPPELDLKIFVPASGGMNIEQLATRQTGKIGPQPQTQLPSPKAEAPASGATQEAPPPSAGTTTPAETPASTETTTPTETTTESSTTETPPPSTDTTTPTETPPPPTETTTPTETPPPPTETTTPTTTAVPQELSPGTTPTDIAPTSPVIGETQDQSEFQFMPTGGGAAIQGGC